MQQFDVFPNPSALSRRAYPFVVCLQNGLLAERAVQVVAPLAPIPGFASAGSRLSPAVDIDGDGYAVLVPALFNLPARVLSQRIANFARYRESLLGAVDLLFYGF